MWLTVEHITRYGYDAPINEAYTEVRLKPLHRDGQRCSSFVARDRAARDDRGRVPRPLRQHRPPLRPLEVHERLSVTVRSEVWTTAAYVAAEEPTLSPLDRWDFLAPTRYVDLDDQVLEVAAADADARRPGRGGLGADARRARRDDVRARNDERAHDRRGGARRRARRLPGLRPRDDRRLPGSRHPARYVSGYLYDTAPTAARASRTPGSTSTSATPGSPSTRPRHAQTERYVRVGVGRDYADAPPPRGVSPGTATETLEVAVTIREP